MHNFLRLILEGFNPNKKKSPKAHVSMPRRVARGSNWRNMSIKTKNKRIIPKKLSMMGSRKLIHDTNRTRIAWDSKGYAEQKFYDNIYKRI
jgi:hypothetical protein